MNPITLSMLLTLVPGLIPIMAGFLRKTLLGLVAIAIVAALVMAFLPQPAPVETAEIGRGPLQVTVNEDGRTRIKERYVVSMPLAGQVRRIELDPGDEVQAGETLLATVLPNTPELLDPRARAEAEARVQAAEAAVQRAESDLAAAVAARERAQSDYQRTQRLHERGAATADELEEALLTLRARQEEFNAAGFSVDIARFELQQARAALRRYDPPNAETPPNADDEEVAASSTKASDLEVPDEWHIDIVSPINGQVLRVLQESAAVLPSGAPLLELGDPGNLELEIDVLSTDAVKITPGDAVIIEHWGGDEPLLGTVRLIEPAAFTRISALGVEEQRVFVIADISASSAEQARLGDGFRFDARIVIWEEDDVLRVPTGALFRRGEEWAVFIVEDGLARERLVEIGHRNNDAAEILSGLDEGERVILYPSDRIEDGVPVEV